MTRHDFICIGDIHLKHGHDRNADRLASLDAIIVAGICRPRLAAWLVLGDVFDARSSIEDRNAIAPRLQTMADVAPVLLVAGNHDQQGDLDVFAKLKSRHPIAIVTRAQTIHFATATGVTAAVYAIPYPHRHALVAAGVANEQVGELAAQMLDTMCLAGAAELAAAADAGALPIVIGHATIAGSRSSVGQPMGLDYSIAISQLHLDRFGHVPKIFGHIHAPQEIYGAHYAGSISANDFGECERKRYLVIEYTAVGYDVVSVPLDTPPLYHVEAELSVLTGFRWRVTRGPDGEDLEAPRSFAGADVRVRYRFNQVEAELLERHRDELRAPFAGARSLVLEPIAIRERAHRAPEVQAARTVDEKVAAFVRAGGFDWTSALADKLARLQGPDAAAFLADVERELSPVAADAAFDRVAS